MRLKRVLYRNVSRVTWLLESSSCPHLATKHLLGWRPGFCYIPRMVSAIVWGTGNVGRLAVRSADAQPGLELTGVIDHDPGKAARDAGDLAGLGRDLGVTATTDVDAVLASRPQAVVYAASGDVRPDDALADVLRAIRAGAVAVTPALYALSDQRNAPPEMRQAVLDAVA